MARSLYRRRIERVVYIPEDYELKEYELIKVGNAVHRVLKHPLEHLIKEHSYRYFAYKAYRHSTIAMSWVRQLRDKMRLRVPDPDGLLEMDERIRDLGGGMTRVSIGWRPRYPGSHKMEDLLRVLES